MYEILGYLVSPFSGRGHCVLGCVLCCSLNTLHISPPLGYVSDLTPRSLSKVSVHLCLYVPHLKSTLKSKGMCRYTVCGVERVSVFVIGCVQVRVCVCGGVYALFFVFLRLGFWP